MNKKGELIVALDCSTMEQTRAVLCSLRGIVRYYKIGKELFTTFGPQAVKTVLEYGARVFLDLKFHDIPNTAAGAAAGAVSMGVSMFNVHAMGGKSMMQAVRKRVDEECGKSGLAKPVILGVTVLTSLNDEMLRREIRVDSSVADQVVHLALLCKEAMLDGVVCSPLEIGPVRKACGQNFVIVTPGVRPEGAAKNDQDRVATPVQAVRMGADYLIIGRPITAASDPRTAAQKILDEIEKISLL